MARCAAEREQSELLRSRHAGDAKNCAGPSRVHSRYRCHLKKARLSVSIQTTRYGINVRQPVPPVECSWLSRSGRLHAAQPFSMVRSPPLWCAVTGHSAHAPLEFDCAIPPIQRGMRPPARYQSGGASAVCRRPIVRSFSLAHPALHWSVAWWCSVLFAAGALAAVAMGA